MSEKASILVLDDNPSNLKLMSITLANYNTLTASTGEECLNMVKSIQFDLIILDVRMPGMDGYEVCRQLKADPKTQPIPVIFVSAYNQLEDRLKGYDAGGQDYLAKPFDQEELLHKVHLYIHKFAEQNHPKGITESSPTVECSRDDLSHITQFIWDSCHCNDAQSLANTMFDFADTLNMNISCLIRLNLQTQVFSPSDSLSRIEIDLLEKMEGHDNVYEYGDHLFFNAPHITLLLKNIQVEDEQKQRLIQHCKLMLSSAESRARNLETEINTKEQKAANALLGLIEGTLHQTQTLLNSYSATTANIANNLEQAAKCSNDKTELDTQTLQSVQTSIRHAASLTEQLKEEGKSIDQCVANILDSIKYQQ